jgi:hypothetical protein
MDVEFDRSSGISSTPAGRVGMAMPRLHRARFLMAGRPATDGVAVRGRACSGKHTLAAGHRSRIASRRRKAQCTDDVCAAQ